MVSVPSNLINMGNECFMGVNPRKRAAGKVVSAPMEWMGLILV